MDSFGGLDCIVQVVADEAGNAVLQDLRDRSTANRDDRCAARQRFGHHQSKWFGPVDWKQQCPRGSEKRALLRFGNFAAKLNQRMVEQRLNLPIKISLIDWIDFRRD